MGKIKTAITDAAKDCDPSKPLKDALTRHGSHWGVDKNDLPLADEDKATLVSMSKLFVGLAHTIMGIDLGRDSVALRPHGSWQPEWDNHRFGRWCKDLTDNGGKFRIDHVSGCFVQMFFVDAKGKEHHGWAHIKKSGHWSWHELITGSRALDSFTRPVVKRVKD